MTFLTSSTIIVKSLATREAILEIACAVHSGLEGLHLFPRGSLANWEQIGKLLRGPVTKLVVGDSHLGGFETPRWLTFAAWLSWQTLRRPDLFYVCRRALLDTSLL